MTIHFDRFTWIVIGIVAALLIGAVITVNLTGGQGFATQEYLTEDTPATPVFNAFLAWQKGDREMLRQQYTQKVLDAEDKNNPGGPLGVSGYIGNTPSRRLRILESKLSADNPNSATVTFAIDTYNSGGLFDGGSSWSNSRIVTVIREENRWKLDVAEYFY